MALGEAEMASGVFFADFGDGVTFGTQTAKGNFDAPGKDAMFDRSNVADQEYRLEVAKVAFSPFPCVGSRLSITTGLYAGSYKVRVVNPMDDGLVMELLLRSEQ